MTAVLNADPRSPVARRILTVAKDILGSVGESLLRVDAVMDGASVQAPVIYRHFGSREGLVQSAYLARFLEVLDLEYALFDAAAQQATSADDFRSAFDDLVTKMLGEEHRAANLTRLEVLAMATSRPELADAIIAAQTSAFARSVPALDHAQQQGWIRSDIDTTEYAVWAVSSTLGRAMIVRFVDHPGMDDRWAVMHHRAVSAVLFGD